MSIQLIQQHELQGWAFVRAVDALSIDKASSYSALIGSDQFQAILVDHPESRYWSSPLRNKRHPNRYERRFIDLVMTNLGTIETEEAEIENLIEGVTSSWWRLLDEGIYLPQGNELYRFQSKALHIALTKGHAWFGGLSALRGLLTCDCYAYQALRQQQLDVEKLGKALRGMEDFGADCIDGLMERAFELANTAHGQMSPVEHPAPANIGTGHLLLSMLEGLENRASQVLHKLQVDPARVQAFLSSKPPEI